MNIIEMIVEGLVILATLKEKEEDIAKDVILGGVVKELTNEDIPLSNRLAILDACSKEMFKEIGEYAAQNGNEEMFRLMLFYVHLPNTK